MKTCSHCKSQKPLSDFYKQSVAKDGHSYWCKECSHGNSAKYKRQHKTVKNCRGVSVTGERLRVSVEDAMTRFELRLNFTGIERLV